MAQNLQNSKEQSPHYQAVREAIGREFAVMMARNMDFSPTPEDLPLVADVLAMDLISLGLTDVAAIRQTLQTCGRTYEKWPSTAVIVSLLKPPKQLNARMYQPLLSEPEKPVDNAKAEKAIAMIRSILKKPRADTAKKAAPNPDDPPRKRTYVETDFLTEDQIAESRRRFIEGGRTAQEEYLNSVYGSRV